MKKEYHSQKIAFLEIITKKPKRLTIVSHNNFLTYMAFFTKTTKRNGSICYVNENENNKEIKNLVDLYKKIGMLVKSNKNIKIILEYEE